jgi:hypothetical protein
MEAPSPEKACLHRWVLLLVSIPILPIIAYDIKHFDMLNSMGAFSGTRTLISAASITFLFLLLAFLVLRMLAWVSDSSGLSAHGQAQDKLRERGYDWLDASQLELLWLACEGRSDWVKKLPPRDEVALTLFYQGDTVDSLIACAQILLSREREAKYQEKMKRALAQKRRA